MGKIKSQILRGLAMIKVNWDVEELVALIDIYRKSVVSDKCIIEDELQALAERLVKRADKLGIVHDEKFRNLNGMKMMFQNVVYVATDGKQATFGRKRKNAESIFFAAHQS